MLRFSTALILVISLLTALGVASASAQDAKKPDWANVNICDSSEVGVRAGLSGGDEGGRMRARITLQWRNPVTGAWAPVAGAAASDWLDSKSEDWTKWESGWTFKLKPLPQGASYELRGAAELQLLRDAHVVRSGTQYSATCRIG